MWLRLTILLSLLGLCPAVVRADGPTALDGPDARLLQWLLANGKIGPAAGPTQLEETLRASEAVYLDGGSRSTCARLGALLIDPQYSKLVGTPAHDNARYYLASALSQQGAYQKAQSLLLELIRRHPPSPFRRPAFRKLIDITLRSGLFDQSLSEIHNLTGEPEPDEKDEIAYLKGKALFTMGYRAESLKALEGVTRASRLYAQAIYLTGLQHLQAGDLPAAGEQFCRLVYQPGDTRYTFFVSDNAYRTMQHATLALARLRHEQERFKLAADTYARLPSDSPLYPVARYESSWSLFRAGELSQARNQLVEFLSNDQATRLAPPARLLLGYTLTGDCMFDSADRLLDESSALLSAIARAIKSQPDDPLIPLPSEASAWLTPTHDDHLLGRSRQDLADSTSRLTWVRRQLSRIGSGFPAPSEEPDAGLALERSLAGDSSHARHIMHRLVDLRAHLSDEASAGEIGRELDQLLGKTADLARQASGAHDRITARNLRLPVRVRSSGGPDAYLVQETATLDKLADGMTALGARSADLENRLSRRRLSRARQLVTGWARQAKLGQIDSRIAHKQALDAEVQNLAIGRYPLSLLRELAEAGLLDEATEYWPYDGEDWPDELE